MPSRFFSLDLTPIPTPDLIQQLEMLDQLDGCFERVGATPRCSTVFELAAAFRVTGAELTPGKAAKALAAGCARPKASSAAAKRGRASGPTPEGAQTPATRPGQTQRQLFTAPGTQAGTTAPPAATANQLPILLSLTPLEWQPFQTIQILLTEPIRDFLCLLETDILRTLRASQTPSSSTK